jgi:translation initiation factor IF-3
LERAREAALDLVEVSPTARPPVCRILDYGKYKYNLAKKASTSRKKQHSVSIKGMRFRPKIEEHDYQFKMKHVRNFLQHGDKVKCFVLFRGREKAHTEFGRNILDRMAEDLKDMAIVESRPKLEGHSMNMLLAPLPGAVHKPSKDKDKSPKKPREAKETSAPPEAVSHEETSDGSPQ